MPVSCDCQSRSKPAGGSKQRRSPQLQPLQRLCGRVSLRVARQSSAPGLAAASTHKNGNGLLMKGLRKHVDEMQLI
ncbi:MAG TPA: hypothetical protein VK608_11800, partial [Edaphobacter sp.]|nr:hypothetical protein [Edaphobacter sp.]